MGHYKTSRAWGNFSVPLLTQRLDFAFCITQEKGALTAAGLGWDLEPVPGL